MKSTFQDAKEALKRPRNIAIGAVVFIASAAAIYFFGYVQWRRFIIPTLVLLSATLAYRMGKRLRVSVFSSVVKTTGSGMIWAGVALILGAWIDNVFFSDIPQMVFLILAAREAWIAFQMSRLDNRLSRMSPEDIAVITQSSDVAIAQLNNQKIEMKAELERHNALLEKLGVPFEKRVLVH